MATRHAAPKRLRAPEADGPSRRAQRKAARRAPRARAGRRRYAVVYDTDGPLVRLGILWFVLAVVALAVGPLPSALLYGGVAAVAAAQTARVWRRHPFDDPIEPRPNEAVAALIAGGMAVGACLGAGGAGGALLIGVAAAAVVATGDTSSPSPTLSDIGWTIQCGLPVGFAVMSVVLLTRLDQGSAIALLLLVSAYETGDYLVGSGAGNLYEGPLAGLCALVVLTFIVASLPLSPLSFREVWVFGGFVAVLAPLGQLVASALLPEAGARASALRRLDSLLLAAPVWCLGVGLLI